MTKKEKIQKITECIAVEMSIVCDQCGNEVYYCNGESDCEIMDVSDFIQPGTIFNNFAKELIDSGWEIDEEYTCSCPDCLAKANK